MIPHVPRLLLSALSAATLALTAGGALGIWDTGAPAARPGEVASAALRPAALHVPTRDVEGSNGDVQRLDPGRSVGEAIRLRSRLRHRSPEPPSPEHAAPPALPQRSGTGRRVVHDLSEQRVWLVGDNGGVRRTYEVSGSRTDNLRPGRYEVYSRSRHAVSYDYASTMEFMVRFAHGERAAIGFHDIPVDRRGRPVQTRRQLGNALSAGCIRQARPDALALWRFADVGTDVVVVR